jgi:hypothetical protein
MRKRWNAAVSYRELTTILTTTMTTVGLPDTSAYTTREFVSRLVAPSACAYGSEGWGFESLRARPVMSQGIGIVLNLRFGFRAFLWTAVGPPRVVSRGPGRA